METYSKSRTSSQIESQEERRLVAWACVIATVLTLSTLIAISTTKQTVTTPKHNVVVVSKAASASPSPPSSSIAALCRSTPYPGACEIALSSSTAAMTKDPFAASVQFAMTRAASARALAHNLSASAARGHAAQQPPSGLDDCSELLDISLDQLRDSLASAGGDPHGVCTWLSAALTNQGTCGDSLAAVPALVGRDAMRAQVNSLTQFIGTALALHAKLKGGSGNAPATSSLNRKFPSWVSRDDRKLLEAPVGSAKTDAVVALDGSGTHTSISSAIASVTAADAEASRGGSGGGGGGGGGRKVIYVKAGTYDESVSISSKQKNVMLMGDGKGKTVIVGHKSAGDGYSTYASATVAAMGSGFIAKGLTIINRAGPGKGQAVALRVGGDLSVVYECSIQGYQDTLYTHSNRQFYSQDDIYGTVDFIFGNSAVVLQNCNIQPRRPGPAQKGTVTAQGRTDLNQNTGISIHKCRIASASDLGRTPVYLGRPWQKYSRTVVMESFLDRSITPAGWLEWSGRFALNTLYYGEYGNMGPGAGTGGRVKWSGVHTSLSTAEATRFTVAKFIFGEEWLGGTGVSYTSGL